MPVLKNQISLNICKLNLKGTALIRPIVSYRSAPLFRLLVRLKTHFELASPNSSLQLVNDSTRSSGNNEFYIFNYISHLKQCSNWAGISYRIFFLFLNFILTPIYLSGCRLDDRAIEVRSPAEAKGFFL
jgi:hypothetical protein